MTCNLRMPHNRWLDLCEWGWSWYIASRFRTVIGMLLVFALLFSRLCIFMVLFDSGLSFDLCLRGLFLYRFCGRLPGCACDVPQCVFECAGLCCVFVCAGMCCVWVVRPRRTRHVLCIRRLVCGQPVCPMSTSFRTNVPTSHEVWFDASWWESCTQ